jgi:G:T-mismatch repair DNA endonuclease (very short patch repair protein)
MPKRNREFWRQKLEENADRDERTRDRLDKAGWTVLEFQECEVEGKLERCVARVQRAIASGPELASPE